MWVADFKFVNLKFCQNYKIDTSDIKLVFNGLKRSEEWKSCNG